MVAVLAGIVLGDGWDVRWQAGAALQIGMMECDEQCCRQQRLFVVVIIAPLVCYLIDALSNIH